MEEEDNTKPKDEMEEGTEVTPAADGAMPVAEGDEADYADGDDEMPAAEGDDEGEEDEAKDVEEPAA